MNPLHKLSVTNMKALGKLLPGRRYSNRKSAQAIEEEIKKIKLYGTAGVFTASLLGYVLFGNQQKTVPRRTVIKPLPKIESRKDSATDITQKSAQQVVKLSDKNLEDRTLREKYNFINKVVSNCAQSVFYLELRDPFKKDPETGEPMVTSNGSGFIISDDGYALTNAHVVLNKPQSTITAIMRDGKSYKVRVEDADMNIDLALLKIDTAEKLPSLPFGQTRDTNIGEWVIALGSPLSLSNSVTVGIVSCTDRPAEELGLKNYNMSYIQTDASITFGNSGGPLINLDGQVIGINNLRLTSGISFAIPVEYVKKFLENTKYRLNRVADNGLSNKKLYGLTTISITPDVLSDLVKENNIPEDVTQGLLIWKIIYGTPAYRSGLEVGDIITHVNGKPVHKSSDFYKYSDEELVDVKVVHRGQKKNVLLTAKEK